MVPSSLVCKMCSNIFNEDRCPRILSCSHSLCSGCIEKLISSQKKKCIVCNEEFIADSHENFLINSDLLDAAKQLPAMLAESTNAPTKSKKAFLMTTEDFKKNITKRGIADCLGEEAEVNDLIKSYSDMRKRVKVVNLSSEKTLNSIDENTKLLKNRLEELQNSIAKMEACNAQLAAASGFISAAPLMQEAEELLQTMEETKAKFEVDKRKDYQIKKEILKMKENLEKLVNDTERITEGEQQPKEGEEEETDSAVNITLEPLMQGSSPYPHLRAFLDLAYESTQLGRIIVRVTENSLKGLNFLHMCVGGKGPSYANSQVSFVDKKGMEAEYVEMGEYYVAHAGAEKSTRAVSASEDNWMGEWGKEIYSDRPVMAGELRGYICYDKASLFWIVTRDCPSWIQRCCFGAVDEGLGVLKEAISKYPDITQVKVSNCGLLFSL
ncbi:E3 ubiquitin-protein ligase TRAIP-like isoform X2 [Macrobrachium nipponense]|uniref:E3 ubiquitin-protein ligase TRAIP-like isoform X2 n=1 Tax=Macrobrachium nipponense TaxID=159736 RepID=UPI0030C87B8E